MSSAAGVRPEQRFSPSRPCPVCGGHDRSPRGAGERCYGFLSDDGEWAHCTRDEHAGGLERNAGSEAYPHKLTGDCKCGARHGLDSGPERNSRRRKGQRGRIVATYDYRDEGGNLLYQTVRYEPKGFSQRRPNGRGRWEWNLQGIRLVLYRLPELIATPQDRLVLVCAGEKDTDRAHELGFTATTNPLGEGKWREEYSEHFEGRTAAVIAHKDPPGAKHAEDVAQSLYGKAASVKVVELPDVPEDGGDLVDWTDAGGNAEDLRQLIDETPEWESTTRDEDGKKSSFKGEGKPNQIDLVHRYIAREPDVAYGVGSWRRYGQGVWAEIDVVDVEKGVLGVLKEAIPEGITPSSVLLSSVVNLLRVEVHIPSYMWADSERGIIVCQNGTLEIEGRNFREHRREDYALYSVAFDYDPDAKAVIWEEAFKERLGDSWNFLQEYAGYSLTTRTDLEASAFLVGPTGCGKSTFIEGLETVAGDQAGTLSLADIERSHYALANIPGKTLLTATEAPNTYLKSTATLDTIVSGEMIQIEKKYQNPERVRPVAKILWAMNELPQIRNPNAGIFRRAQVVPFPALKDKQNPLVKEFIKSEGSGILNWALDGLDRLNAQRWFSISDDMSEATEGFKAGNDIPQTFVGECCVVKPDAHEESNLLYMKYREWCLDNGYKPLASNRMKVEWERLGFKHKKIRGKPYYDGVQLIEAPRFIP
jgi:putative DNA primase/helicase